MRPLAVLILVLAAVAALVLALSNLGGGDRSAGPARAPATTEAPAERTRETGPLAAPAGGRTEASPVSRDEARTEVDAGRGQYPTEIVGAITDPRGNAVGAAKVELHHRTGPAGFAHVIAAMNPEAGAHLPVSTTRSGEEGRYAFRGVEPGNDYVLVVDHPDFARTEAGPLVVGEEGSVRRDVRLQEGILFFGYVRDHSTGGPLEGAVVALQDPITANLPKRPASAELHEAATGEDGRFEFRNVRPGQRYVSVTAEGYATHVEPSRQFTGDEGAYEPADYRLKPESTIAGRVVTPDRRGVPGAEVSAHSFAAQVQSRGSATTGEDGRFTIRGLADTQYRLVASAEGWGEGKVQRVEAGTSDVQIELVELGGVVGRVVDPAGEPVSDFRVSIRMVNENSTYIGRAVQPPKTVRGSGKGAFEVQGLAAGKYVAQVAANGYAESRSEPFTVVQGVTTPDVVVRMSSGGTLVGTVLGADGAPVKGAVVSTQDDGFIDSPFTQLLSGLAARRTSDRTVRSDAEGRFRMERLIPDTYQVKVKHPRYVEEVMNGIAVSAERETDLGTISLVGGASVEGRVYHADGGPAAGVSVTLSPLEPIQGGRSYDSRTNEQGRYVLPNVRAGDYKLTAARSDVSGNTNPFQMIVDMKHSEVQLSVRDGNTYTQDLYLGSD